MGGEEENAASARILWDVPTPEAGGTGRKSVSPELLGGAGPGGRGDSLRLSRVNLFPIHEPRGPPYLRDPEAASLVFLDGTMRSTSQVPAASHSPPNQEQNSPRGRTSGVRGLREQPGHTRRPSQKPRRPTARTAPGHRPPRGLRQVGNLSALVSTSVKMGLMIPVRSLTERGRLMNACEEL